MLLDRHLEVAIRCHASDFPVISLVGPRQSGKTTLARKLFPDHTYLSLENLDLRRQAEEDPRGFLNDNPGPIILDEVQRTPDIFSYLQERVDLKGGKAHYVLTGSQQFLLMKKITQSLAGRVANFRLFPFTIAELEKRPPDRNLKAIFQPKPDIGRPSYSRNLGECLIQGFYPPLYDRKGNVRKWLENYILTYIERDVRSLLNVEDLRTFEIFLRMCATQSGQLTNLTSIASNVGVSQPTVKRWLSLLETSGIVFLLPPYHENFRKRLVKTPKLYFIDTGVLCFLLSIKTPEELKSHPLYGAIFETFIVSDFYKRIAHLGETPPLYFWRDKTGHEIDLLVDFGSTLLPIEIKSSSTYSQSFQEGIQKWMMLAGTPKGKGLALYNGDQWVGRGNSVTTLPWWFL